MESRVAEIRPSDFGARGVGGGGGGSSFSTFTGGDTASVGNTRSRGTPSPSFLRSLSIFCRRSLPAEGIVKEGEVGEPLGDELLLGRIVNRGSSYPSIDLEREWVYTGGADPGRGDAGIVSRVDANASRSMGGLRLGHESDESEEAVDFLERMDPERVLVELIDWVLEQEELARLRDFVELELEDTESMDALGKVYRSITSNGKWMCMGSVRSIRKVQNLSNDM